MSYSYAKRSVSVFVSSTYKDLQPHRAEVERCLVGMSLVVKGMEFFGSSPDTPLDTCLKQLAECSLLILIVGASYGSIEKTSKKSFTELEYEYAIANNIPVLAYLADMKSTAVGIPLSGVDIKHAAKLEAFKKRLTDAHTVSYFTSIDDLGKRIEHDVPNALSEHPEKIIEEMLEEVTVETKKQNEVPLAQHVSEFRKHASESLSVESQGEDTKGQFVHLLHHMDVNIISVAFALFTAIVVALALILWSI